MSKIQKIFEDSLFKIKIGLMINDVSFEEWKKIYNIYLIVKDSGKINYESIKELANCLLQSTVEYKDILEQCQHLRYKIAIKSSLNENVDNSKKFNR